MALFTCSACGTEHRVSVAQTGYFRLPCRNCGQFLSLQDGVGTAPTTTGDEVAASAPVVDASEATSTGVVIPARTAADERACPQCGRGVHEQAIKCRHCRARIGADSTRAIDLPLWIGGALLAVAIAVILAWTAKDRILGSPP